MLNNTLLSTFFNDRVSFKQVIDECTPKLHPTLLVGNTLVNSVREAKPFLEMNKLYQVINDFDRINYTKVSVWDGLTSYVVGSRVKFNDGVNEWIYYALQDNVNETPSFDSDFWETDLSYYLRNTRKDSVLEAIKLAIKQANVDNLLKDVVGFSNYFEERNVYKPYTFQTDNLNQRLHRLQYLQISLRTNRNLKVSINKIGIKTDTVQTVPFYLFHSSQPEAIQIFNIDLVAGFNWYDIDVDLNYISDLHNAKGVFLLGFYESETIGNFYTTDVYRKWINECPQFQATFSNIEGVDALNPNLIPVLGNGYGSFTSDFQTFFNFQYRINLDYTYSVIQAPEIFDDLIQYDIALRILSDAQSSVRANTQHAKLIASIDYVIKDKYIGNQINGYHQKTEKGLGGQLQDLKDQLKLNIGFLGSNKINFNYS
jgi:hypothetical protein